MLDKLLKELFSMRMMSLGLLIFLVAIAKATFIESDFGTPASKIAIYNTRWFELLLLYLTIGLIVNIFKYKMYQREKAAMFAFHLSFIVIIIGAALTRYVGFEGSMPIDEGEASNIIHSADPYFMVNANNGDQAFVYKEQRWLSEGRENPFAFDFQIPNEKKVTIEYVSFLENFLDTVLVADSLDGEALEFVIQGQTKYLFKGSQQRIGNTMVSFEAEDAVPGVSIFKKDNQLFVQSIGDFEIIDMMKLSVEDRMSNSIDSSAITNIVADTAVRFYSGRLYVFGNESVMFREHRKNIEKTRIKAKQRDEGTHYLTVRLTTEGEEPLEVEVPHFPGSTAVSRMFHFAGLNFEMAYGPKRIELPFSVFCKDFQLDRYPGSNIASSFASEVTVIDEEKDKRFDQRIFMNNVMDYRGYRFFQSGYQPDESGTILSVNYDWWGTNVTYIGYLLMSIGMALSLFAPAGRFVHLNKLIKKSKKNRSKLSSWLIMAFMLGGSAFAHGDHGDDHRHDHHHHHEHEHESDAPASAEKFEREEIKFNYLTKEQAEKVAQLLVQDYDGRIIPFHTLSDRIWRKVHQKNKYGDINPVQVVTAFHLYGPSYWAEKPIIFVSAKIKIQLGTDKYISLKEAEDEFGNFKWIDDYQNAFEKPDSKKTEFDKQIIKLGERYQILKEIFQFAHLRIIPVPDDPNGTWVWPFSVDLKDKETSANRTAINLLSTLYAVTQEEAEFSLAEEYLEELIEHQWEAIEEYRLINPTAELPTPSKISAEIKYNELNVFDRIKNGYFLSGFLLLILFFVGILSPQTASREKLFKRLSIPFLAFIAVLFVFHGIGLGYRWYISGHAPWSNGYEAVVFIAWSTVLAGFFFIRKNAAVIPATALLAGMMLFVTELNLLDPEITPLQPVLKSYWLMIHVAIITSSYGFLGLSAILGIVNLILYIVKNNSNKQRLTMNINELTAVSEMTMTIGLFMLTIGTFLGGIWANESWGRYWGWDPKETWALVSVLTYAIILHLRFIPKMNDKFLFNALSIWGYSAILFTFFGVNFKLVGLHSYAQGDGVAETPTWVWVTIFAFFLFTIGSAFNYLTSKAKK